MAAFNETKIEVFLKHGGTIFVPVVVGEITVEWTRIGAPGKMTLTVIKDSALKFREGDTVRLRINDKNFFFGFIFTYEKAGRERYALTCYDALRYLKSQDVIKMEKMTYTKALKKVCKRYGLQTGTVAKTGHIVKGKVYTGTILDMLESYRKKTKQATGDNYILYADYNRICLKSQASMKTQYVIQANLAKDYSYQSTIDDGVYTVIKLYKTKKKKTKVYSKTMKAARKKYGVLTYANSTSLKKDAQIRKKLKKIGNSHDTPRKKLSFSGVFGVQSIRAGSGVVVNLKAPGLKLKKSMVVDKATHRFRDGVHTMDLVVIGGDYRA